MNVYDLKKMLSKHPDDMEVIISRYSDYAYLEEAACAIVKAVPKSGGWIMRTHATMSEANMMEEKGYLCLGPER